MEKIIDRETKVLMLQVLKQGYSTCKQRVMIVSAFSEPQPDYDLSFLTGEERTVLLRASEKVLDHECSGNAYKMAGIGK